MNAIVPVERDAAQTRADRSHWPYRLSYDDVLKMQEVGILDPDARVELLDGELVEMPEEGALHVWAKNTLSHALVRMLPGRYFVATDSTLKLSDESAPDPDIYVAEGVELRSLIRPDQVRLAIEVADSSVGLDLGRKARLYARHAIADYWVLDLNAERTHVLRSPTRDHYDDISIVGFGESLTALHVDGLTIRIGDLPGMRNFGA